MTFSNFAACMFAGTKDCIMEIIWIMAKRQTIFCYWSWRSHLQHCKLERSRKEIRLGIISWISVMYDCIFQDQLSFHSSGKMLHLYDFFVCKHNRLYRCIKEILWVTAIWLYCVLWLIPATSFVNHDHFTTLRLSQSWVL